MSEKRMQIMRDASYLLPPPGGEVVRDLLDSYDALQARHNALREAEKTISECLQDIAFRNGVNAGWNAALLPTDLEACAKKAELLADPCNRLATLKAARAEVDRLIANGGGQEDVKI